MALTYLQKDLVCNMKSLTCRQKDLDGNFLILTLGPCCIIMAFSWPMLYYYGLVMALTFLQKDLVCKKKTLTSREKSFVVIKKTLTLRKKDLVCNIWLQKKNFGT